MEARRSRFSLGPDISCALAMGKHTTSLLCSVLPHRVWSDRTFTWKRGVPSLDPEEGACHLKGLMEMPPALFPGPTESVARGGETGTQTPLVAVEPQLVGCGASGCCLACCEAEACRRHLWGGLESQSRALAKARTALWHWQEALFPGCEHPQ